MTCGGTPSIYAGDEQAFRGIKEHRAGGDDAIRPAFPATPADLAPFGWPIYRLHQDLIGMRRRHPWLHTARTHTVELANTHFIYEVYDAENRLLVALNLADAPVTRSIPHPGNILAGDAVCHQAGPSQTQMTLSPHGWAIFAGSMRP
jgi:cyclomaltodextrinase